MASTSNGVVANLKEIVKSTQQHLEALQNEIRKAEKLIRDLENPDVSNAKPYDTDFINKKLSFGAKFAIEASKGPLEPVAFINFFMMEVFGKPKPGVLPIVRKYTLDVEGLLDQLSQVKTCNNDLHDKYMEDQRRLDENMNKRIDKLCKNIQKELDKEKTSNRRQTTMGEFITRPHRHAPYQSKGNTSSTS